VLPQLAAGAEEDVELVKVFPPLKGKGVREARREGSIVVHGREAEMRSHNSVGPINSFYDVRKRSI
jgi:hypothetical protein